MAYRQTVAFILIACSLGACTSAPKSSPTSKLTDYEFPGSIDPAKRYLFYLYGKIIEEQGIPAISPDYGEYEYKAILDKLDGHGFVVISEARPKNTDGVKYVRDEWILPIVQWAK